MAYELQLTMPVSDERDLASASAMRTAALHRVRIAETISSGREDQSAVVTLLTDAAELLRAADAFEQDEPIEVSDRVCSDLDSIEAIGRALRAGIAATDYDGHERLALEDLARALLRVVGPMVEGHRAKANERLDRYVAEKKAERAEGKAFSERWTALAIALEGRLDDDQLDALHRLVDQDPAALAERLSAGEIDVEPDQSG